MARIDWSKIPVETREKIFMDICMLDAPCDDEGYCKCIMTKYNIDCDTDNDHHCAVKDFIFQCLKVKEGD